MISKSVRVTDVRNVKISKDIINILSVLDSQKMRFTQLMHITGINPKILDRRIRELISLNAVERENGKYCITESGKKLLYSISDG